MPIELWLTYVAATIIILIIPGPTVLMVLSYALSQGRRVAVGMALGVATGDLIAMTASLLGLGTLVLASATLFSVLKWIGAVYLVYLGIKLLRAGPAELDLTDPGRKHILQIYFHAAMVTVTNPKTIVFFIAFVPQFIRPETALTPQFAILIATFVTLGTFNALVYALLADKLRSRIRKPAVLVWLNRIGGGVLVTMGAFTASLGRS